MENFSSQLLSRILTSDNSRISEVTPPSADSVERYVRAALAENTLTAYAADLAHFTAWGGNIPSSPEQVAHYLAAHAKTHAPTTLARWLTALAKAHRLDGLSSPTDSELVRLTLRGIRRTSTRTTTQARALTVAELGQTIRHTPDDLRGLRDRALLLIGFAAALRRSELVGLDSADIHEVAQGVELTIRHSKTDRTRQGRIIAIPLAQNPELCPVRALRCWLERSGTRHGPIFQPIDQHGHIGQRRLSGESVGHILRQRAEQAGLPTAGLSGHSLRAGLATSAAASGAPSHRIRAQTGHQSDAMLARYIRQGERFTGNVCVGLF
jgi:site-specific recombinase XerD